MATEVCNGHGHAAAAAGKAVICAMCHLVLASGKEVMGCWWYSIQFNSNLYLNSECIEVETSFTMQPNETTITKMKALRHKKMPKRNLHKSDDKDLKHNKITIKM